MGWKHEIKISTEFLCSEFLQFIFAKPETAGNIFPWHSGDHLLNTRFQFCFVMSINGKRTFFIGTISSAVATLIMWQIDEHSWSWRVSRCLYSLKSVKLLDCSKATSKQLQISRKYPAKFSRLGMVKAAQALMRTLKFGDVLMIPQSAGKTSSCHLNFKVGSKKMEFFMSDEKE